MDSRANPLDHDAMLAHSGWLRALAASLVSDSATAEDLVQDTWVAALEHPPELGWKVEPWLARVLKNFAFRRRRDELRRAEHELAASGSAGSVMPDRTAETLDLQATILEAVREIDEPFRATIVMRYFEGRSSAEIARAQNVPAGTVRWRLKRGLDELRERLDERFDGARASWFALLVPLTTREGVAGGVPAMNTMWKGAFVMNVTQAALTATVLVAAVGIVWWSLDDEAGVRESSVPAITTQDAMEEGGLSSSALDAASPVDREERVHIAPAATPVASPAVAPPVEEEPYVGTVDARFVNERGEPKPGVRFAVVGDRKFHTEAASAWSGPDGRATLDVPIPKIPAMRRTEDGGELLREWRFRFTASIDGCATVECAATLRGGEVAHLGDVVLGPGSRVHGRVVDENGRGMAGASIGVAAVDLPEDANRIRRLGSSAFHDASTATSDAEGTFVLDGVAVGTCRVWSHADDKRYAWSDPIAVTAGRDVHDVELVLTPMLATDRIEGRVVDPDGGPVAHASLFYTAHAKESFSTGLRANEDGRFELMIQDDGSTYDFTARDPAQRFAQASILGVVPGTLDLVLQLVAKQFVDVRVVDPDGRAIEGVTFAVSSRGYQRAAQTERVSTDRYRVEMPEDVVELEASAPGWRTQRRDFLDPRSLPSVLEIVMHRAPIVRGRVVAGGRGVPGAHVEVRADDPDSSWTVNGFRCVMSSWSSGNATSDDEGRFEVVCDLDGAFWLRATAEGWVAGEIGPIDAKRLADGASVDVELTHGGALEGHVLLPDGSDAEGEVVAINHGDGLPRTMRAGPNGRFRFEGLAPGRWQVMTCDAEIDPGKTRYGSTEDTSPIEWSCEVRAGATTRHDLDLTSKK